MDFVKKTTESLRLEDLDVGVLQSKLDRLLAELQELKTRSEKYKSENIWYRDEIETLKRDNHEYISYLENKKDEKMLVIQRLSDKNQKNIEMFQEQRNVHQYEHEKKILEMTCQIDELEIKLVHKKAEFLQFSDSLKKRTVHNEYLSKIKAEIVTAESEHHESMIKLEKELLDTRIKVQQDSELQIEAMESLAHGKAAQFLCDHSLEVKKENVILAKQLKEMSKKLSALIDRKDSLLKENGELEREEKIRNFLMAIRLKAIAAAELRAVYGSIIDSCLSIGCCFSCALRYIGVREWDTYKAISAQSSARPPILTFVTEPKQANKRVRVNETVGKSSIYDDGAVREGAVRMDMEVERPKMESEVLPCPACLGILQMSAESLSTHALKLLVPYSTSKADFNLSIRMPFQLAIRHKAMVYHIDNLIDASKKLAVPVAIEVKEVFKMMVSNEFAKASHRTYDTNSLLMFAIQIQHTETEGDYKFLTKIPKAKFEVRRKEKRGKTSYEGASVEKIVRALSLVDQKDFQEGMMLPPPAIQSHPSILEASMIHSQVYVAGRYCKLKRHISNSQWIISGKRMTEDSMEELIGNFLLKAFNCDSYKFSSAGREDSDVLMLGTGRPFYFEIINPRKATMTAAEMSTLQILINCSVEDKISVRDLQVVTRENTSIMKESAATKSKTYSCLIQLETKVALEALAKVTGVIRVNQQNPTRVPRRADLLREKTIEAITLIPLDILDDATQTVRVDLKTSAGTYVKEFMHGDNGRTVPCLSTILDCGVVKVISLDVLEIHLDWPTKLSQ